MNKRDFWIGIGVGVTVGVGTGFIIGNKVTKKRAVRDIKKIREKAYLRGREEAVEEAKQWIDDFTSDVVLVNSTDPDEIKKAVDAHLKAVNSETTTSSSDGVEAAEEAFKGQTEAFKEDKKDNSKNNSKNDEEPAYELPDELNFIGVSMEGDNIVFANGDELPLKYPKWLFLTNDGDMRDIFEVRRDLKKYDHVMKHLMVVWNRLGWGTYIPDLDAINPEEEEDISDYDVSLGDEPMEKTLERERYLNEVEKYISHPEEAPRIISKQDFDDECYLDKRYFDYFDVDNKFIENTEMDSEVDPMTLFGVVDGNVLFNSKPRDDDEPDADIVHVKNFKMNSVIEVTRYHKSYESVKDGSAYI